MDRRPSAILIVDWVVLAVRQPVLKAAYPLPGPACRGPAAWSAVAADAARAPVVIAVFAVLGVAAAVLVRNALGAFALAGGVVLASLAAAGNFAAVAPWTLAYWVSGWMQFRSHGYVIYHFWVDGFSPGIASPGLLVGIAGIVTATAITVVAAVTTFERADITA